MKVCIFANRDKDKDLSVSRFTADCFTEKGVECIICDSDTLKKGTLLRFREELKSGKDKVTAMIDAAKEADKSICQSALVFFCGPSRIFI